MNFSKKAILILILVSFIFPLSAFSSRKKIKDNDSAALERQKELLEQREKAEAEIAARKAQAEREEEERIAREKEEAERLEKERIENERLEAERIALEKAREEEERLRLQKEKEEAAALEEKKAQELLQQKMAEELEKQKKVTEKKRREYLSDYMVYDSESIDESESDEDEYNRIENPDERDAAGRTMLMRAAKSGNEWELKLLINSGCNVNLTDEDGWTALMYAVRYSESFECLEVLLDAGSDVSCKNNFGSSALVLAACYNGNPQILSKLISQYKSTDREVLRSLVFLLSEQNISERQQLTKLQLFMDAAVPLNVLYEGKTPLMYAAQYGNSTKLIQKLLDNQASVTLRSTEGKTAFDYAMKNNNLIHDQTYWSLNQR